MLEIECPGKWNLLSACLLICQFFVLAEKSTDLKSVDMSTNQQICFFLTDRRPGTIFLRRLSPWGSEPSLLPKVEKKHDLYLHASIMRPHYSFNHAFPSCSPAAIGEYQSKTIRGNYDYDRELSSIDTVPMYILSKFYVFGTQRKCQLR